MVGLLGGIGLGLVAVGLGGAGDEPPLPRVPEGFAVERVAGPPLVDRPIVADFDERGRLYVADSSGSNAKVEQQLEERPHRIVRLVDEDGDGRYDRSTVFADRMMFPEGAMWRDGSLYVAAPPSIWKLTDADDDGVAESRVEWFQGKTLTGCANDLHGPYNGPDGRIYWCKGAFARQEYDRPGKPPFVTRAAHVFRARPDGTEIEPVMTGGMDNPVEVAFTPGGERIFTTTFLQHPEGGNRDGLIHALYGGLYGKDHDVLEGHPRTSPGLLNPMVHLGPAAPSGLMYYRSDTFWTGHSFNTGSDGTLFAALFNLHKVTRHPLTVHGATFGASTEDFVTSDDPDFHPTDVLEDADGSLLVIDTGGWYKLCCPTSQLVKPDVLGALYRVRRADAKPVADPRGLALNWERAGPDPLADRLADPRPAVRDRAAAALAKIGPGAVAAIRGALDPSRPHHQRLAATWAACRIDGPEARAATRSVLADRDLTVRQAAAHSAGLHRDGEAWSTLVDGLRDGTAQDRRAAAEALGRIGDPRAVPALLEAAAGANVDRSLAHSITYAILEIGDPASTAIGLASVEPRTRAAALLAIEQMEGGRLDVELVAGWLTADNGRLRDEAAWVIGRHPEWAGELVEPFRRRLAAAPDRSDPIDVLIDQLAGLARTEPIAALMADRLADRGASDMERRLVLVAMERSGVRPVPAPWIVAIAGAVGGGDQGITDRAVAAARALSFEPESAGALSEALAHVGADPARHDQRRLDALAATPGGLAEISTELFTYLVAMIEPASFAGYRSRATEILAAARLDSGQLATLADALAAAGPIERDRLLKAFERADDPAVGRRLVAALRASKSRTGLRAADLRPILDRYGPAVAPEAEALYAELAEAAAGRAARIEAIAAALGTGDVRRGQAVFNGSKAACATCHALGYLGGKLGPDLTRIGAIRTDCDLLEAIVEPSASFVRSYEPLTVATTDGRVLNGLLKRDDGREVVLATGADQEVRIPRDQVEEMKPGEVSVMPAGLESQLTAQELADLIAFLKAAR